MNNLPFIVRQDYLTHSWWYHDEKMSQPVALVARYDQEGKKKWFQQYHFVNKEWTEGAPTPLPIFGIHLLPQHHSDNNIYIFEGEKCTEASHNLNFTALSSMMGAMNAANANWTVLAHYPQHRRFVLVPDNDEAGKKYMQTVYEEIRKANPQAEVKVCLLPLEEKGEDFIDWLCAQGSCPKDWDGFKPIDEPASIFLHNTFEAAVAEYSISSEEYFTKPTLLKPETFGPFEPWKECVLPVKNCPINTFPEEMKEWVERLSEQMQVPADYLAAPLLIYAGTAIGRKRGVLVRKETDWIEFPNLWGMLIGRPSSMKSPAMKTVRKPLDFLINEAKGRHEKASEHHIAKLEIWKVLKKEKESHMKKVIFDKFHSEQKVDCESVGIIDIGSEPKSPPLKRYKTDDATVEKLGELLIENPQGLLLFRDELAGWLCSFEKAGRENDRPFFLESWSGRQDFNIDRIGRGCLYVPALYLSIIGSIQPGPLAQYVRSAVQGGMGDDGFIQRFQIMVWPEVSSDWELITAVPLVHLEEKIKKCFVFLDQLAFDTNDRPILIEFDDEAQAAFDSWQTQLEKRIRKDEIPSYIEAHLAKYKKLVPALSLIFHYLHTPLVDEQPEKINLDALNRAIIWSEYLESHAEKIYLSGVDIVQKSAKSLLKRIKKGEVQEPFSARDIYQGKHWSGLSKPEEVQEVLNFLYERNYLMQQKINTLGRPTMKYWVHPEVFNTKM